jgi:hypothetical protein
MSTQSEKIAALLAKAERTDNEHERQAYNEAAERLMLKWGIEEAVARSTDKSTETIIEMRYNFSGPYAKVMLMMMHRVTQALGLRGYYMGAYERYYVVGHSGDIAKASSLFNSLQMQVMSSMNTWWKGEPSEMHKLLRTSSAERAKARRSFIYSFGVTVSERIENSRRELIEETTGAALVLAKRSDLVKDYMDENHELGKGRGVNFGSSEAGHAAGARADLGEGRIGGVRAIG